MIHDSGDSPPTVLWNLLWKIAEGLEERSQKVRSGRFMTADGHARATTREVKTSPRNLTADELRLPKEGIRRQWRRTRTCFHRIWWVYDITQDRRESGKNKSKNEGKRMPRKLYGIWWMARWDKCNASRSTRERDKYKDEDRKDTAEFIFVKHKREPLIFWVFKHKFILFETIVFIKIILENCVSDLYLLLN